ncbi:hypothetical protein SAMN04488096_10849 [Mesonia phycicola]|uniref:Uncharacterized protein n=1 Tax=Mesonia phycicola TaxID=579105 RepID=A0A1M6GI11_9FLAO|nr:hypothetical protein [Mesonia phycicola]SHJ09566.1 hypothetical protein SAMN04488096_10849 [Mesonia phycicola]
MEEFKIILFLISTFFGIEGGRVVADKTTVSIYPEKQEVEIIQENLFTVLEEDYNAETVIKQWRKIEEAQTNENLWREDLKNFTNKQLILRDNKEIKPQIKLTYTNKEDLEELGIWYNEEQSQFSINHLPQEMIKTEEGVLKGNYWYFDANRKFTFTIQPFLKMPEKYKKIKKSINSIVD